MFCYLDKSFCTESQTSCGNIECDRYFTDALKESAAKWAVEGGFGHAPIAYSDFSKTCGQYQKLINPTPVRETFGPEGHRRTAQILNQRKKVHEDYLT